MARVLWAEHPQFRDPTVLSIIEAPVALRWWTYLFMTPFSRPPFIPKLTLQFSRWLRHDVEAAALFLRREWLAKFKLRGTEWPKTIWLTAAPIRRDILILLTAVK